MLTKEKALEALKIDDKLKKCPISLFKKDTIILYIGRCRESSIVSANGEKWVGMDKIHKRQFGYVYDFILNEKEIHTPLKIGDIVYCDLYAGEIMPYEVEKELLYFKVVKKSEINIIIN
jgi:hypothetical protein